MWVWINRRVEERHNIGISAGDAIGIPVVTKVDKWEQPAQAPICQSSSPIYKMCELE